MAFSGKAAEVVARAMQHKGAFASLTLTGAYTLEILDGQRFRIDPGGGSRDVTLSADWQVDGMCIEIVNAADAAEDLVIKDPAASTIVTISQNEKATVAYNGSAWVHMGIITIALS